MSHDDWDHVSQDDTGPAGMLGSNGDSLSGQAPPPAPKFGTEEEPEMTAVEKSWDAMEPPEAWVATGRCLLVLWHLADSKLLKELQIVAHLLAGLQRQTVTPSVALWGLASVRF